MKTTWQTKPKFLVINNFPQTNPKVAKFLHGLNVSTFKILCISGICTSSPKHLIFPSDHSLWALELRLGPWGEIKTM
jgi:hypothetical protein